MPGTPRPPGAGRKRSNSPRWGRKGRGCQWAFGSSSTRCAKTRRLASFRTGESVMDLPLFPTPRADHEIMTVWGKSCQAASGSKASAVAALNASRRRSRSSGLISSPSRPAESTASRSSACALAVEREHVGLRVARKRFRRTDSSCRFQAVHFRHPHIHKHQVIGSACRTSG